MHAAVSRAAPILAQLNTGLSSLQQTYQHLDVAYLNTKKHQGIKNNTIDACRLIFFTIGLYGFLYDNYYVSTKYWFIAALVNCMIYVLGCWHYFSGHLGLGSLRNGAILSSKPK